MRKALLAALILAALGAGWFVPAPAAAQAVSVLSSGHVDVGPYWDDEDERNELRFMVKEGFVNETFHHVDDVVLRIAPGGRFRVPASGSDGKEWEYVGNRGEWMWRLPEQAIQGVLWAGFNNSPPAGLRRHLSVELIGVEGPGEVALWEMGAEAPFWSTRSGLPMARTATGHHHMAWYFTRGGTYCLTLRASGRRLDGSPVEVVDRLTLVTATDDDGEAIDAASIVPCGRLPTEPAVAEPVDPPRAAVGGRPVVIGDGANELRPRVRGAGLAVDLVQRSGRDPGAVRRDRDVVFYQRAAVAQFPTAEWQQPDGDGPWGSRPVHMLRPRSGGPELGWSTTSLAGDALDGDLAFELVDVTAPGGGPAPGSFSVDDSVSRLREGRPVLSTSPGFEHQSYGLWPGFTSEGTWSFSAPGVYCVELGWTGELVGGAVAEKTITLTFAVDVPAPAAPTIDPANVEPCSRIDEPEQRTVIDSGHVDVVTRVIDGELELSIGDDADHHAPDGVTLVAKPAALETVPSAPGFEFLGQPGDPVWVLPQTQDPDLLWPGWNTTAIPPTTVSGPLEWRLEAVRGPGDFALWTNGVLGGPPAVVFSTRQGLPGSLPVAVGTHAHANWGFGAEGIYCLDFGIGATYRSGRALEREATVLVVVGAVDAASATEADCPPASTAKPAPLGLRLRPSSGRLRLPAGRRAVRIRCITSEAAACRVRARIRSRTAKRLGLSVPRGRRWVAIGRGRRPRTAAVARPVAVRLARRPRAALRRSRRAVPVELRAVAIAADGRRAARTATLRIR